MSDLLLDGALVDAVKDSEWILVGSVASVFLLGVVLGLTSWLKGRRAVGMLVWLLIGACAAILLIPVSTIQGLVDTSTSTLTWSVVAIAVAALLIGFVSAARLARPPSWWAQRLYDNDRYAEAIERHQWTRPQAR